MNVRFSKLALLAVVAYGVVFASGQTPRPAQSGQAQFIVQEAMRRIAHYDTIEAKLRVRTDLMGQPLVGSGEYAQLKATSGLLLRLELAMQAGGQASSVKQICNGRDLWEHWRLGDNEKLHHVDLRRVEAGLAGADSGETAGNASSDLARGGLPKLLSQLEQNFDFSKVPPRIGTTAGVEMWVVTGVWKQERLEQVAPEAAKDGTIIFKKLPVHLPHQVELQLGQSDLFPYRITYQRWSPQDGPAGGLMKPAVTTEFYEVALNAPLDPSQFNYQQPNDIGVADRTGVFLKSLGIAKRATSTQKR